MDRKSRDRITRLLGTIAQIVIVLIAVGSLIYNNAEADTIRDTTDSGLQREITRIDSTLGSVLKWKEIHEEDYHTLNRNSRLAVGYLQIIMDELKIAYPENMLIE